MCLGWSRRWRRVGLGRGVLIARDPFPQAARRTRRAPLDATGSPRELPLCGGQRPGSGDVPSVAVPGDRRRLQVEQGLPVHRQWSLPAARAGESSAELHPPPAVPHYQPRRAIRGTGAKTIVKWQNAGWKLDTQRQRTLQTEMTFRRVKPKNPWQQLAAVIAKSWAAYRRMKPQTQQPQSAYGARATLVEVKHLCLSDGACRFSGSALVILEIKIVLGSTGSYI